MVSETVIEGVCAKPAGFENLYGHKSDVFEYVYVADDFIVEARDWGDLLFKLSLKGIELVRESCEIDVADSLEFVSADKIDSAEKPIKPTNYLLGNSLTGSYRPYGISERELDLRFAIANRF